MSAALPSHEFKRLMKSADAAMLRAAQRAREVAGRTGTHLVVEKDGQVQKLVVDRAGRVMATKNPPARKRGT